MKAIDALLEECVGEFNPEYTDALVVHVDDVVGTQAIDDDDGEMQIVASRVPGVYWKVGQWGDKSCFRQELSQGVNNCGLFIWSSTMTGHEGCVVDQQQAHQGWGEGHA